MEAVARSDAQTTYRRLGGGTLPDEEVRRGYFRDDVPLATGEQLRLGVGQEVHK
ncbi:hypothetical protein [Micromonospora sp. NPDC005806]|uniref:hypothetical protein n=1 Tax=Micromonospora sp. NPDC005806 TaxID=3364234 RepID=UPI0036887DB9